MRNQSIEANIALIPEVGVSNDASRQLNIKGLLKIFNSKSSQSPEDWKGISRARAAIAVLVASAALSACSEAQQPPSHTTSRHDVAKAHKSHRRSSTPISNTQNSSNTGSSQLPQNANALWPCSLIPSQIMQKQRLITSDKLLPGQQFDPSDIYSCTADNFTSNTSAGMGIDVNVGSTDPTNGTNGYSQFTLSNGINVLEKVNTSISGGVGTAEGVYIQTIPNNGIVSPEAYYGSAICSSCDINTLKSIEEQVAVSSLNEINANNGTPPAGVLTVPGTPSSDLTNS